MQLESPTSGKPHAGLSAVPLFHAAWLFAAGVAFTKWSWLRPSLVLVAMALVAVLCGIAAVRAQRLVWLTMAALWCLLGAWCALMEPHPAPAPELASLSDGLLRTVEGTVVDAGAVRGETEQNLNDDYAVAAAPAPEPTQRIDLHVSSVEAVSDTADGQTAVDGGIRLTVRWPEGTTAQDGIVAFRCGERVRAVVRMLPPQVYHDPGAWSREEYLLDQGITSSASVAVERVERIGSSPGEFLACRIGGLQRATTARLLGLPAAMRHLPRPLRLTPEDAIMLAAMVAGDRTYLTHSLRVGFERTGSFHMLVVSGFHLAIVASFIFWITRRLRIPRVPATFLTILVSFAYALFTGFATPVQRSLWMVTLYLLGRLVYRERSPLNTIGFASLCLLVASPRSLFESSLQMTLLAVVAIAGVAAPLLQGTVHPYLKAARDLRLTAIDAKLEPRLAQFRGLLRMVAARVQRVISPWRNTSRDLRLDDKDAGPHPQLALLQTSIRMTAAASEAFVRGRLAGAIAWGVFPWTLRFLLRIVELLVVSCIVELAMTLPMAVYFHRITLLALPVNLFILPLLAVLMPAALLTLILLVLWPTTAVIPAMGVAMVLHFGVWLVNFFGSMQFGDFRIPDPPLLQSTAFYVLFALAIALAQWCLGRPQRWRRRLAWVALLSAAAAAVAPRPIDHPRNALLVEAIDVGQGDSLLVITPDGRTLLVDGGGFGGGLRQAAQDYDIGEEVVSPALWARGIRHLDTVALSHAHSDHMGGLPAVLRNFHPDELWVGNNPSFDLYNALLEEAARLHVRVRPLRAGDGFGFGRSKIDVLAPLADYVPKGEPGNNDSLVLHVGYGATSVLLEGDAEGAVEDEMLSEKGLESTLLKVGHHGSSTSTRPEFLARVKPQWAVISCGLRNRYGHPREEILRELQAAHVRTFRTDTGGATCFALDGKTVTAEAGCGR
jgi:competence protein ComEC